MPSRNLLFLSGLGAPAFLFTPWFLAFRWFGYRVHPVPNSRFSFDPVSTFAERTVETAAGLDELDVVAVSYGGNAALYAAHLSRQFCTKTRRMALVCAPLLGAPGMLDPVLRLLPQHIARPLEEMSPASPVTAAIRELGAGGPLPFDLHCLYHERDYVAPEAAATLGGAATAHRLDFEWRCVPGLLMHQAACVNPGTLRKLVEILIEP